MAREQAKAKVPDLGRVNVFENAVLVSLRFTGLGNRRTMDSSKVDTDADLDMLHVSKKLLDAPEYRAIRNNRSKFKWGYFGRQALPSALGGTATFVMPLALLPGIEREYAKFLEEEQGLIEALCAVWDERVTESKAQLRGEADPADYPPVAQVRAAFRSQLRYWMAGTPDSLKRVSRAVHAREVEKFYSDLDETAKKIDAFLGESLAELVSWMVERLSDSEDGKRKTFGKSFDKRLEKVNDFLETFKTRNLTGNVQLEGLVQKAKALLRGVDASAVSEERFRKRVRDGFGEVKSVLDALVEVKATRRIVLED